MKFNTIEEVKEHKFVGCHAADYKAFNAIDRFVLSNNTSLADKAEALRVLSDDGMGLGREEHLTDEQIVQQYQDSL